MTGVYECLCGFHRIKGQELKLNWQIEGNMLTDFSSQQQETAVCFMPTCCAVYLCFNNSEFCDKHRVNSNDIPQAGDNSR